MTAYEVASTIVAVLGLIGGAIGFVRSLVAGRAAAEAAARAADAQADASVALQKSAAADQRIAAALEVIAAHQGATPHGTFSEQAPGATGQHGPGAPAGQSPGAPGHPITDVTDELRALVPPAEVHWAVEPRTEAGTVRLRNLGTITATQVHVDGATIDVADAPAEVSVAAGDAVVVRVSGATDTADVTWLDARSPDTRHAHVAMGNIRPR